VQGLGRRQYADLRETQKSAANEAKRNKSISRNQSLQNRPFGRFFVRFPISTQSSKVDIKKVVKFHHFQTR